MNWNKNSTSNLFRRNIFRCSEFLFLWNTSKYEYLVVVSYRYIVLTLHGLIPSLNNLTNDASLYGFHSKPQDRRITGNYLYWLHPAYPLYLLPSNLTSRYDNPFGNRPDPTVLFINLLSSVNSFFCFWGKWKLIFFVLFS